MLKMKTRTNAVLLVLTVLTYFTSLHPARAFYDPGTQRWLTRDPIGEMGGVNLYIIGKNDCLNYVDLWGEDIGIYGGGTGNRNNPYPVKSPGRICGYINGQPVWCMPHRPLPNSGSMPPSPSAPCPPKAPNDCWGSLPSDKLRYLITGIPKLEAAEALATGCNTCCSANFFNKPGDDYDKCLANCEAKKQGMLGIGEGGGGVRGVGNL